VNRLAERLDTLVRSSSLACEQQMALFRIITLPCVRSGIFSTRGKVRQRTGQPVDSVDHDDFDQPLADMLEQALERRALHGRTRQTTIIVTCPDKTPAFARLALDERLARLALGVQGIEVLLQTFFGRLPGVDRAAPEQGV
jgi:hypothetical protein